MNSPTTFFGHVGSLAAPSNYVFEGVWPLVRRMLDDGVRGHALFAFSKSTGDVRALGIPRRADESPQWFVIGRHTHCDLSLLDDPDVALRQLLVRIRKVEGEPVVRIIDLRTQSGMVDGLCRECGAVGSNRHAAVGFAGSHAFVLDLDALANVRSSSAAWAQVEADQDAAQIDPPGDPAPRPLAAASGIDGAWARPDQLPDAGHEPPHPLRIGKTGSFVDTAAWLGEDDSPIDEGDVCGHLFIDAAHIRIGVSRRALERGLLVGRYSRCLVDQVRGERADSLSRVHLCLLLDAGEVWAVDTASSNGTAMYGMITAAALLGSEAVLRLAGVLSLRWRAASVH